ncbi:MAG TPA: hypothetical protein VGJ36_01070 [Gemmatimonadales bacterium]|jgi:hypothetical protein
MLFHFGRLGVFFGWVMIVAGIAYLAIGGRGAYAGVAGSLPRMVVGLIAVVLGSSIVRWAKRTRSD